MSYSPLGSPDILPLEDAIRGLVERLCALGYEHTPALEFQFHLGIFDHALDFIGKCFQKSREKSQVMVKVSDTWVGKSVEPTVRLFFASVTRISDLGVSKFGDAEHCS